MINKIAVKMVRIISKNIESTGFTQKVKVRFERRERSKVTPKCLS